MSLPLTDGVGEPEQVDVGFVTPNFFSLVGIETRLGRGFAEGDTNDTAILSDGLWRRRFAADPDIVGQTVRIAGQAATIVGVLPPGQLIYVPEQSGVPSVDTALWRVNNWNLDPDSARRDGYSLKVFARLAPGASLVQAQQEADAMAAYSRENLALGFSLGLSVATALLFGLLPATQAVGRSLTDGLRQGGVGSVGARRRVGRALIVAEVAISLVLLVSAGLLGRSFLSLANVSPGFEPAGTITFRAAVPPESHDAFVERVAALPGVVRVAGVDRVPLARRAGRGPFVPDTIAWEDESRYPASLRRYVTVGYFETLGIELLRGRLFDERDAALLAGELPVRRVVVDQRLADTIWPNEDLVGRTLRRAPASEPPPPWEVVGVVRGVHEESLREESPGTIYFLVPRRNRFVVRTASSPSELIGPLRGVLRQVAPEVPLHQVRTMSSIVAADLAADRLTALLAGAFALVALLLASVGLYGVIAYAVSQRMQEMGIRMALGAQRTDVTGMVVGDGLRVTVVGATIGLVAALLVSRVLSAWLYGVSAADPATYAVTIVLLFAVSTLAAYLPARRAASTDPMRTLRDN